MSEVANALRELGLSPNIVTAGAVAFVIIQQVWHFFRTRGLQKHRAALERQLETLRTELEEYVTWYEGEAARIHKIHTERYTRITELSGWIERYCHYALRVCEGSGKSLRGEGRTYCELLEESYWKLRNYVMDYRQILRDDIYSGVHRLTDVGKILIDECKGSHPSHSAVSAQAHHIQEEAQKVRHLLHRRAVALESPQVPSWMSRKASSTGSQSSKGTHEGRQA